MSISRAAQLFQINKRTLYDHYKGKYKDCPKRFKNKGTVLTQQEEQALVDYLKDKINAGYAIRRIDLKKAFLVCLISRWIFGITLIVSLFLGHSQRKTADDCSKKHKLETRPEQQMVCFISGATSGNKVEQSKHAEEKV